MSIQKKRIERELTGLMVDIDRLSGEVREKQKELRKIIKEQRDEEDKTLFEALNKKQDRVSSE